MSQSEADVQARIDSEHLRLLSIFHFVAAGLGFLGLMFSSMYMVVFQVVMADPRMLEKSQQGLPPGVFMGFFRVFILIFVVWFLISAVGNLMSALFIRKYRHRTFSMVMAGINCLHMPIGTVLGIITLIVLARDSVSKHYESALPPRGQYV